MNVSEPAIRRPIGTTLLALTLLGLTAVLVLTVAARLLRLV